MSEVRVCSVPECTTRNIKSRDTLHRAPTSLELRQKWCELLGIGRNNKIFFVCSKHFLPQCFTFRGWQKVLRAGSLPIPSTRCRILRGEESNVKKDHDYILTCVPVTTEESSTPLDVKCLGDVSSSTEHPIQETPRCRRRTRMGILKSTTCKKASLTRKKLSFSSFGIGLEEATPRRKGILHAASCAEWLKNIGREDLKVRNVGDYFSKNITLCAVHFTQNMFSDGQRNSLKENAVPTIFKPIKNLIGTKAKEPPKKPEIKKIVAPSLEEACDDHLIPDDKARCCLCSRTVELHEALSLRGDTLELTHFGRILFSVLKLSECNVGLQHCCVPCSKDVLTCFQLMVQINVGAILTSRGCGRLPLPKVLGQGCHICGTVLPTVDEFTDHFILHVVKGEGSQLKEGAAKQDECYIVEDEVVAEKSALPSVKGPATSMESPTEADEPLTKKARTAPVRRTLKCSVFVCSLCDVVEKSPGRLRNHFMEKHKWRVFHSRFKGQLGRKRTWANSSELKGAHKVKNVKALEKGDSEVRGLGEDSGDDRGMEDDDVQGEGDHEELLNSGKLEVIRYNKPYMCKLHILKMEGNDARLIEDEHSYYKNSRRRSEELKGQLGRKRTWANSSELKGAQKVKNVKALEKGDSEVRGLGEDLGDDGGMEDDDVPGEEDYEDKPAEPAKPSFSELLNSGKLEVIRYNKPYMRKLHILKKDGDDARLIEDQHTYFKNKRKREERLAWRKKIVKKVLCHLCGQLRVESGMKDHLKVHKNNPGYFLKPRQSSGVISSQTSEAEPVNHTCRHCGTEFDRRFFLVNHLVFKHDENLYEVGGSRGRKGPTLPWKCGVCAEEIFGINSLRKHCKEKHDGAGTIQFPCEACPGKNYSNPRKLRNHMKRYHTPFGMTYLCDLCGISCSSKDNLLRHTTLEHPPASGTENSPPKIRTFVCQFCGKKFYAGKSWHKHIRQEHDPNFVREVKTPPKKAKATEKQKEYMRRYMKERTKRLREEREKRAAQGLGDLQGPQKPRKPRKRKPRVRKSNEPQTGGQLQELQSSQDAIKDATPQKTQCVEEMKQPKIVVIRKRVGSGKHLPLQPQIGVQSSQVTEEAADVGGTPYHILYPTHQQKTQCVEKIVVIQKPVGSRVQLPIQPEIEVQGSQISEEAADVGGTPYHIQYPCYPQNIQRLGNTIQQTSIPIQRVIVSRMPLPLQPQIVESSQEQEVSEVAEDISNLTDHEKVTHSVFYLQNAHDI